MLGQSSGLFGINTLIYGLVILLVITFLPEGIWPRVLRALTLKRRK